MSIIVRLFVAAGLLAATQLGVSLIQRSYVPAHVELPAQELNSLPLQIGPWHGEDIELDPRMFQAVGAHSILTRTYRHPAGGTILVHMAILTDAIGGVPHYPEVCFPAAGWSVAERRGIQVSAEGATAVNARLLSLRCENAEGFALYWYQMGKTSFVDRDSYRHARRHFFGRSNWPAVVKVLLQTTSPNVSEAELREFAESVLTWGKVYQGAAGEASPAQKFAALEKAPANARLGTHPDRHSKEVT